MLTTVFAGQAEYFSGAITSGARNANLNAIQANSIYLDKALNEKDTETFHGMNTNWRHVAQIDTDSVVGSTNIMVNATEMKIEDFYKSTEGKIEKRGENNYILHIDEHENYLTSSLNKDKNIIESKKIKYIMAHKVSKRLFKIKHKDDEVIVTKDHSIIILRDDKYIDIKPSNIKEKDKIILYKNKITLIEDFEVQDLGIQEEWVYDIEVEDNHNFFGNDICVHNSLYMSVEPLIIKKFGGDYENNISNDRLLEFTNNFIEKVSLPVTYKSLTHQSDTINAFLPEKLIEDAEIVADCFISVAPKMYFCRKLQEDNIKLAKPKLKVTGLSMIRATTPKFFRKELSSAMDILIDGDLPKVIDYMKDVKVRTNEQMPSQICINQGVSSLDYDWHENDKKFKKWVKEKKKWLGAPMNSRASLIHNKYINDKNIEGIKEIEAGDKIGFIYMKEPNITGSNAFAFNNEKVFEYGLDRFIDRDLMYTKQFEGNIKLITDPIGWDLTPQEDLIDEEEW